MHWKHYKAANVRVVAPDPAVKPPRGVERLLQHLDSRHDTFVAVLVDGEGDGAARERLMAKRTVPSRDRADRRRGVSLHGEAKFPRVGAPFVVRARSLLGCARESACARPDPRAREAETLSVRLGEYRATGSRISKCVVPGAPARARRRCACPTS